MSESVNWKGALGVALLIFAGCVAVAVFGSSQTRAQTSDFEQFPELREVGKVTAPRTIAPGKIISFNGTLKTKAGAAKAKATSACIITSATGAQCSYTVRTERGQLTAAGFLPIRGGSIPITGGTGSYEGAKGELKRRDGDDAILVAISLK